MKCELSNFLKNLILCLFIIVGTIFSASVTNIFGEKIIPETKIAMKIELNKNYTRNSFSILSNETSKTFTYEIGKKLLLLCDGTEKSFQTNSKRVKNLLEMEKIVLGKEDFINKSLQYELKDSDFIQVKRVLYKYYDFDEPLPFQTVMQNNPLVANGIKVVWQPGEIGVLKHKIRERYEDGKLTEKKVLSKINIKAPTTEIIALGSGFFTGQYKKKFRMCASSYNPTVEQCDSDPFTTATGRRVRFGIVAVDPSVIKLGSKLWVSGYGYAIAADTGGLIKKMKIDLFFWRRLPGENWKGGYIDVYLLD
ncbi:MAG: hypothetical protein C0412_10835 [Flavobacterium sp.]|nr:hypothetical protein [Flavobacterium sp.]